MLDNIRFASGDELFGQLQLEMNETAALFDEVTIFLEDTVADVKQSVALAHNHGWATV